MKMKSLKTLAMMLTLAVGFMAGGCSDEPIASDVLVYQEYAVFVSPTLKAAYANMRENGATGQLIYFKDYPLTCNALTMFYQQVADGQGYNYSAYIDSNHEKAVFKFKRSDKKTYVNEIEFSRLPEVKIPGTLKEMHNGIVYNLPLTDEDGTSAKVWLEPMNGTSQKKVDVTVNFMTGDFTLSGVAEGIYNLYVERSRNFDIQQGDGDAGGTILLVRQSVLTGVEIK